MTFTKKMGHTIAAAFVATAQLQAQLKALGKRAVHSKEFATKAAHCVAAAASKQYRASIVAYEGQRGMAFGVQTGTKEDGSPTYERTNACNATRMWFVRNVVGGKKVKRSELKGVWAKIAEGIQTLNSLARKLHKDEPQKGAQLKARIEALVEQYS